MVNARRGAPVWQNLRREVRHTSPTQLRCIHRKLGAFNLRCAPAAILSLRATRAARSRLLRTSCSPGYRTVCSYVRHPRLDGGFQRGVLLWENLRGCVKNIAFGLDVVHPPAMNPVRRRHTHQNASPRTNHPSGGWKPRSRYRPKRVVVDQEERTGATCKLANEIMQRVRADEQHTVHDLLLIQLGIMRA